MAKAAHPSGLALGQTKGACADKIRVGSNYDRQLCVRALDHGFTATLWVLMELSNGLLQEDEWMDALRAVVDARWDWMRTYVAGEGAGDARVSP